MDMMANARDDLCPEAARKLEGLVLVLASSDKSALTCILCVMRARKTDNQYIATECDWCSRSFGSMQGVDPI